MPIFERTSRADSLTKPSRARAGRVRRRLGIGVVLMALTATLACEPPAYGVDEFVGGLDRPWDLAFVNASSILVTEKGGRVSFVTSGQRRTVATIPDVVSRNEGGLMGLDVDPGYAANRRIYVCMLSGASGGLDVRVVRFTVDEGYTGLSNRVDLLTGIPATSGRHSGCRVKVGPDGHLWVTTGDATLPLAPQDITNLAGKVLRMTTEGAPAPGNPGGLFHPLVYSAGHRNPQGLAFRPSDGATYTVEHGPDRDDEVNRIKALGNYGWKPHPPSGAVFYDERRPMTDPSIPFVEYPVWASGTPTIAPSGATFISGSQWGNWDGALAMAALKGRHLRVLDIGDDGRGVGVQWVEMTTHGRLRTVAQGPDGNIYVLTDGTSGRILRMTPRATT